MFIHGLMKMIAFGTKWKHANTCTSVLEHTELHTKGTGKFQWVKLVLFVWLKERWHENTCKSDRHDLFLQSPIETELTVKWSLPCWLSAFVGATCGALWCPLLTKCRFTACLLTSTSVTWTPLTVSPQVVQEANILYIFTVSQNDYLFDAIHGQQSALILRSMHLFMSVSVCVHLRMRVFVFVMDI